MQRTRNNDRGVAYQEYLADVAKEEAEVKSAADAAQEAAAANDPVAIYAATANAEAEHNRQLVLSGVLNDEYLSQFGQIVRQPFNEAQVQVAMNQFMAEATDYIKTPANAKVLIDFMYRNNISPAACDSYRIGHAILKTWNGYVDEVAPQVEAEVVPVVEVDARTPSEIAEAKYKARMTEIVVYDPLDNRGYTEFDLERCESAKERRLRRLMEGKIGNNLYGDFLEIKDAQHARDQDIAARAAAEAHEEGR